MVFGFERKCAMASLPVRSSPFMLCLFVATCLILLRNTSIIASTTRQLSTAVKDRDDHLRQQQHSSPSSSSYSPCGDDEVLPGLPDVNLFMIVRKPANWTLYEPASFFFSISSTSFFNRILSLSSLSSHLHFVKRLDAQNAERHHFSRYSTWQH